MKNIMFFCIPAYGHHNPTLPVARELVKRGNNVRYYSFSEFEEKVRGTGAEYICCDGFLPEISEEQKKSVKTSTTEMTIADLRVTAQMDGFLKSEVESFKPDVIVSDSVCFWGKLTARKYKIPIVISTTTFAFNKFSSKYMKNSFGEIKDIMSGSKRIKEELKKLEEYGYHEKSIMPLVKNDNYSDTIVYATESYQPCSESFSRHYAFVGPSVFSELSPNKKKARPLIYISLGTVVNERPEFYKSCIKALGGKDMDVIISYGREVDISEFGDIPGNIEAKPYVDQLEILSRADVFVTHCGMNSVSESLYMGTPMVLFPQTNEQRAVAKRANEIGAGIMLKDDSAEGIFKAVSTLIENKSYSESALKYSADFRNAPGPAGAAEFIESAPHLMPEEDKKNIFREFVPGIAQLLFWVIAVLCIILLPKYVTWLNAWILAIIANVIFAPFRKITDKLAYPIKKK